MKKLMLLLASLLVLYVLNAQSGNQAPQNEYVANRVIIKFRAGIPAATLADVKARIKNEIQTTKTRNLKLIDAEVWEFSKGKVSDIISKWKNDPRIKYIEPDYIVHGSNDPNDPLYPSLWGMAKIKASQAWDITTGSNVVVGVIDAGVDYNHPDLAANIWTNPGEIANNGIDDDNNGFVDDVHGYDFVNNDGDPMDDNRHGTHVAGTIAARGNNNTGVVGVNWTAKIMALKFLGSNGSGTNSDAIRAIQYATQMGARLTNNSWGGGSYSQAMYDAIKAAGAANIMFVAAAGNTASNNDAQPYLAYPSTYDLDNIISVAATDINDLKASFSNYGATTVDLGAPGVDILSTYPLWHPSGPYATISGTSMAAPHVAGVAALIWSQHPTFSAEDVKTIIMNSVDPIASMQGITASGGRLNAFKALTLAQSWTQLTDPSISLSQASFTATLDPDAGASQMLSISNPAGARKLVWNISAPSCSWLSLSQMSGTTAAGTTTQLQLNISAFDLAAGNYQCSFNINSNDPGNPTIAVQVSLTVNYLPPPVAAVAPSSVSFNLKNGQNSGSIVSVINNAAAGSRNLHWSASLQGSNISWLSAAPLSGVIAAQNNQSMQIIADATGLSAGTYQAVINISTNDAANPGFQVPVTLSVADPGIDGQKLYSIVYSGTMKRSELDGSDVATVHTGLDGMISVTVDEVNHKVYWADLLNGIIYRSNLNGSNTESVLSGLDEPYSIAVDPANSYIYWIEVFPLRQIRRAKLDGSGAVTLLSIKGQNANGLSLDVAGGKMYWCEGFGYNTNGIWRANLDGTAAQKIIDPPSSGFGQGDPFGLALDLVHGKLFWGEGYPNTAIHKVNLDGSGDQVIVTESTSYVNGLAVDPAGGKIYWTSGYENMIYRANTDGTALESLNISGSGLALDLSPAALPELSIDNVSHAEGNSGTTVFHFTVSLSKPAGANGVTFDINTQDNTATTADNDYVQKSFTSQSIPAGSSTYSFDVTVNGDINYEQDETFYVKVINATGANITGGLGIGKVTNDDPAGPTASVLSVSGSSTICKGNFAYLKVDITGGTAPYTVVYTDGVDEFTVPGYTSGSDIPVSPSATTTYSLVSVTDAGSHAGSGNSGTPTMTVTDPVVWYLDADADGHYVSTVSSCESPGPGYNNTGGIEGDCNDGDNSVWQSALLFIDADADGYSAGQATVCYGANVPAGYSLTSNGIDCNDNDASTHTVQTWYLDADGDTHYVSSVSSCGSPGAGYNTTGGTLGDCNDNDNSKWQSALLYIDVDGDGYDAGQATVCYGATIPAGYKLTTLGGDCNDNDASTHATQTWYLDADGDSHYVSSVSSCGSPGAGYNTTGGTLGDCNDNDNSKWQSALLYIDVDGDGYDAGQATVCYGATIPAGYKSTTLGSDCNDNNAAIKPTTIWYKDADNDNYSDGTTQTQCLRPSGYKLAAELTAITGDCNDANAAVNPGAAEICGNGIDDNCNGQVDEN
ncbi:MAG TPA: S8 family serine peptidase, partial [Panacibacter sp.]|nr:S8 family serine peptidase [Panacibacter sp.]HNP47128.1 S8 family serine peptidase [Panacibacter sp.]